MLHAHTASWPHPSLSLQTWALMRILSRPDIYNVQLVQTSTFNTTKRAQIAGMILDTLGRYDVPLGIGRWTGEQGMPQYEYASNFSLADFQARGGTVVSGTDLMAAILGTSAPSDPVVVIEIAPATSLGDVLSAQPSLANRALCVAMSGSIRVGYDNSSTPAAEYNVKTDIAASQFVYNSTWLSPLVTAPLDTTIFDQFFDPVYTFLLAGATPNHLYATTLMAHYTAWYNGGGKGYGAFRPFNLSTGTDTLYDLQAAYMAGSYVGWTGGNPPPAFPNVVVESLQVAVDSQGYTRITPGAQPVLAATSFPNPYPIDVNRFGTDVVAGIITAPVQQ